MSTDPSFTIEEFCRAEKLCRATFYNLLKNGTGPRIYRLHGDHGPIRISPEARREWHQRLEALAETADVAA